MNEIIEIVTAEGRTVYSSRSCVGGFLRRNPGAVEASKAPKAPAPAPVPVAARVSSKAPKKKAQMPLGEMKHGQPSKGGGSELVD